MTRKGWWQQLQSGEYIKTKLKYGDSNWVIGRPSILKPSPNTSSPFCTIPPLPKHRFNIESCPLANANNQLKPSLPDPIKEPQITIAKIQKMLNEVYEANKLHELLSSALDNLKEIYKTNKSDFSNNDIVFLKNASNINNSLKSLIKSRKKLLQEIWEFRKKYPNSGY